MRQYARNLFNDENGATALEYGLLAALIAGVIVTATTALGAGVNSIFDSIANTINAAMSGS